MSTYNCEFCNLELKTKYSLKKHQNYNKKCLEIQNINDDDNSKKKFECEFCNKDFTSNYYLNHHLLSSNSCKVIAEKNKLIDEKLKIIEDQKNEIQDQKIEIQNLLSKIEDLQKQNDEFQNTMKEIAIKYVSTPKIVNNKYTFLSTFNLTKDEIF